MRLCENHFLRAACYSYVQILLIYFVQRCKYQWDDDH